MDAGDDTAMQDSGLIPGRFVGFVQAMWALVTTATTTNYKERYEPSADLLSSSKSHHEAQIRDEEGLPEVGKRLKRVTRNSFKYVDGHEYSKYIKANGLRRPRIRSDHGRHVVGRVWHAALGLEVPPSRMTRHIGGQLAEARNALELRVPLATHQVLSIEPHQRMQPKKWLKKS